MEEEAVEKGGPPRLGWVIFSPGERPKGFSMELRKEFVSLLKLEPRPHSPFVRLRPSARHESVSRLLQAGGGARLSPRRSRGPRVAFTASKIEVVSHDYSEIHGPAIRLVQNRRTASTKSSCEAPSEHRLRMRRFLPKGSGKTTLRLISALAVDPLRVRGALLKSMMSGWLLEWLIVQSHRVRVGAWPATGRTTYPVHRTSCFLLFSMFLCCYIYIYIYIYTYIHVCLFLLLICFTCQHPDENKSLRYSVPQLLRNCFIAALVYSCPLFHSCPASALHLSYSCLNILPTGNLLADAPQS